MLGFVFEFSSEGFIILQALWTIGCRRMIVTLSEKAAKIICTFEVSNSTIWTSISTILPDKFKSTGLSFENGSLLKRVREVALRDRELHEQS